MKAIVILRSTRGVGFLLTATALLGTPAVRAASLQTLASWSLPADTRAWTDKVTPEVLAAAGASAGDLDVLVKLREPSELKLLSPAAPERLRFIADADAGLAGDWSPAGVRVLDTYSHVAALHLSVPPAM